MEKKAKPFSTVDEYITLQSPDAQKNLQKLRAAIKKAAPDAQEVISYGMPAYKYNGMLA